MKTTQLQQQINSFIGVKNHINTETSTIHSSKQALYNRMFHADNFTKYQPTGNESKHELLYNFNVHVSITSHCLKRLSSKGNLNAMELNNNINHTVSKEDLTQEVLLFFVEYSNSWNIDNAGNVTFSDDETVKALFTCISGYLRRFQTKHYKHQYIEIDGDIVDCNKVSALADYVSIDDLLEDIDLQHFIDKLQGIDKQWLLLRLQGLSNLAISKELNVTYEKIRACEKRVRKNWNN